jgi:hypothetical protein
LKPPPSATIRMTFLTVAEAVSAPDALDAEANMTAQMRL